MRLLRRAALNGRLNSPSQALRSVCGGSPVHVRGYSGVINTTATETTRKSRATLLDHHEVIKEQRLVARSIYSPGSPLFHPDGAHVFNKLVSFLRAQYRSFGFEEVITPSIYKRSLWERSGHWENYADDMFSVVGRGASGQKQQAEIGEDEIFGLKPMNCPGHCLLFDSANRVHKDLPIRYADFSALHRNEISGSLSGLTRLRRFHQDDGHIFCRPSQVSEEVSATLEFVTMVYRTFKLPPVKLVLSTRPHDQYIGTVEDWDRAENALKKALDASGREWSFNEGDGAFYGPKIDISLSDMNGKEHQTATIQLDFQLPQRFDLHYNAPAPEQERLGLTTTDPVLLNRNGRVTPVIIHRAVLGSLERFMALLMEHFQGAWPFWISPRQATVITAGRDEETIGYAKGVVATLSGLQSAGEAAKQPSAAGISDAVRAPLALDEPTFRVNLADLSKPFRRNIETAKFTNVLIVVRPGMMQRGVVEVDLSRHPDQQAMREILATCLSQMEYKAALDNPNAVELSPKTVFRVFVELSRRYE